MKRRKLIQSLALMGLCTSTIKFQALASCLDRNKPLKIAGLGHTPCDMMAYFTDNGLHPDETYTMHYEKQRSHGHSTIDLINDVDIFITNGYKYLLIVSPAESEMKELANGMIDYLDRHNLEYHVIIWGPFPFEGKLHHELTEKLVAQCYNARSIKHVEMHNVIKQYGQMLFNEAMVSLYNDLLLHVKEVVI